MNNSVKNTARLLGAGPRALLALTLATGVLYPLAVTGIAQGLFPGKANGSEITSDGRVVGSSLIGRQDYGPDYFQPRPANGLSENSLNTRYQLILSGATNLSADNEKLVAAVRAAKAEVVKENSTAGHRVAERNHLPVARVQRLVDRHTEGRTPGFMGEPRVNVRELDIALKDLLAQE
ncbi:potassium-transporting ATPase subunit C [Streptomyces violaceochromogenes]|uniref:Potassium-transporting ATPase subunit C n=1 Tax=Streptomyces violaceochromogenes TaxID=67377 RepID=A0ABU6MBW4_9ACTN|nr:potassium-transporting ATPase subunit C [Streptomyces violaceochromogenes]MEC7057654.1 potassium-transporting ATPase subunit C [Streptomyces violaceochromogenes]